MNIFVMSMGRKGLSWKCAVSSLLRLGEKSVGAEIRQVTRPHFLVKMLISPSKRAKGIS